LQPAADAFDRVFDRGVDLILHCTVFGETTRHAFLPLH
jgi:hypothetical protein